MSRSEGLTNRSAPDGGKSFPLSGDLIDGRQSREWLTHALARTREPVRICSGYLRSEALLALLADASDELQGRILVRWQFGDLVSGASDLAAYPIAKDWGLEFSVRQDFHGKVFSIPDQGIVVGSANATLAGLALKDQANYEVCTRVEASNGNLQLVDDFFAGAVVVTDALFEEMSAAVAGAPSNMDLAASWPLALMNKLEAPKAVGRLLSSECLWAAPEWIPALPGRDDGIQHDRQLLGLVAGAASKKLANHQFVQLKIYRWLVKTVRDAGGEIYFGELSAALQSSLLDSPALSRLDVKSLVQNLIVWCAEMPECKMQIDRPRHSQRIRIIN